MSRKYKVIYAPAAMDDLHEIAAYILYELKAPQAAKNVTSRIRNEIRSLANMPQRYALVEWEPWASMKMHRVPIGNYVVFYTADDDTYVVTVTRIFYGGRDIEHIIRDSED